jgi:hypothetical protein
LLGVFLWIGRAERGKRQTALTLATAVPEASTWAMMLIGFAGLLAHAKERKVNQTTATTDPTFSAIEGIKRNRRRMEVLSQTNDDMNLPAYSVALAAQDDAVDALCCTPPTTIAGARAAIEYVMHVEDMQEVPAARAYLENLLASPLLSPD